MFIAEKFPGKMMVVLDHESFVTSTLLHEIENSVLIRASFHLLNNKELVLYVKPNDNVYYYSSDQWVCCVL